jgi:phospholipid transport system substrate-binding protein
MMPSSQPTQAITAIARRALLAVALASITMLAGAAAASATPAAEEFVQANVQVGLSLLNNHTTNTAQKREQFERFILGLTDMKRISNFTLGQYRRTATPQEQDAFAEAFQNYAVAVYQSYFAKYSGQTLKVTGSQQRAPGDTIVTTQMIDPHDKSGQQPLQVDFRILGENGKYVVIDFSVAGIWLALEERDQFSSFLGQHNGSIPTLITHLKDLAKNYK